MRLLEVQAVKKFFHSESGDIPAVTSADFSVAKGEFACIIGRSGSGKSTLLNMCAGILSVSAGDIYFSGQNITKMRDQELSLLRNQSIGYIMQGYALLPNLTIEANIQLPYYMYHHEGDITSYTHELLEAVGLSDKAHKFPGELSGGEIRRTEIARSLINRPELIIADEPTGDLDKLTAQTIMDLFGQIHKDGTTILMVTHDLDAIGYCQKTYTMEQGVLYDGDHISRQIEGLK